MEKYELSTRVAISLEIRYRKSAKNYCACDAPNYFPLIFREEEKNNIFKEVQFLLLKPRGLPTVVIVRSSGWPGALRVKKSQLRNVAAPDRTWVCLRCRYILVPVGLEGIPDKHWCWIHLVLLFSTKFAMN